MEKQRSQRFTKSCRRLLSFILLLIFSGLLFAQNKTRTLTTEQLQNLRLQPESGQNLYTKTDIKFTVTIPNVRPAQVQVLSAEQESDITFRTMRKIENYEEIGTTIEIWYSFFKKGTYTLTPLSVMLQNRRRSISFTTVTVTEDPATMNPRIVIVFEDGTKVYSNETDYKKPLLSVKTGRKLHFTVNLQYATQLMQFTWDIPKDSIFTCTKEFEFTEVRHRERVYSHDLIPVAAFEWTGLMPGIQTLPKFKFNAAGYNGYRTDLYIPEVQIEFTKASLDEADEAEADIFSAAFYQEEEGFENLEPAVLTKADCCELADLYTKEHLTFFNYVRARKSRISFEDSHGLISSRNPIFPSIFLYLSIIIILLAIAGLIISLRKKHRIRSLIFVILLIVSLFAIIYCIFRASEKYGISTGAKIYSIPQENAEASSEIGSGIRVRILEKTGSWYYVEVGETGGWCNSDNICIIR